jgi:hypothetical protein
MMLGCPTFARVPSQASLSSEGLPMRTASRRATHQDSPAAKEGSGLYGVWLVHMSQVEVEN